MPDAFESFLATYATLAAMDAPEFQIKVKELSDATAALRAERELIGKAEEIDTLHNQASVREEQSQKMLAEAEANSTAIVEASKQKADALMDAATEQSVTVGAELDAKKAELTALVEQRKVSGEERSSFEQEKRQFSLRVDQLAADEEKVAALQSDLSARLAAISKAAGVDIDVAQVEASPAAS